MAIDLNKVLNSFKGVKRNGSGKWKALCPCHADSNASLCITVSGDKILLCCMAGCNTSEILEASGLSFADLGSGKEKQSYPCLDRILYGKRQQYGESTIIKDHYDYFSESGRYLYTKIRFEGGSFGNEGKKLIRYYRIDYAADSYESGRGEIPKVLYRLPELIRAIQEGYPVYITEGEKDVETLRRLGWTATTAGGVNDWQKDFARYFKGADVRILPDNDKAGLQLADQIKTDLTDYAYRIRIVKTSEADKGDVTDYLMNEPDHDKKTLQDLIDNAAADYAPWVDISRNSEHTNVDRLARIFSKHEYYLVCRTPEDENDRLFIYQQGFYKRCNRNDIRTMIRQYLYIGKATTNSIDNVLKLLLCDENHLCSMNIFDNNEHIINVRNGLLDIMSMSLKPHSPDFISKWQYDIEYQPEKDSCPVFTKYINDLCLDEYGVVDIEKRMQLQEIAGLIVSNVRGYRTKKAAFLYSAKGNSGKSQFINLLQKIIGEDKVANIPLSSMKPDNRFALVQLPKCRLVSVGDQTDATITDSTVFKQLTGSDMVRVEEKNKASYAVRFNGVLLYGCNALPEFKDDKGEHLFERLLIIPCIHSIPDQERDPIILDRMLKEKNAIFNWMLEGLQRLIGNGFRFTRSEASEAALQGYRNKIDTLYRFMYEANYIVTENMKDAISKKDFYSEYVSWCKANGVENMVLEKNLSDRMEKYGCIFNPKANLSDGRRGYAGFQRLKRIKRSDSDNNDPVSEGFIQAELDLVPFAE